MRLRTDLCFVSMTKKACLFAAMFFVLALPVGSFAAGGASSGDEPAQRIEVTAKRFSFEPAEITLKKDQPVDLVLTSTDVTHGLRVRELGIDVKAGKGGKSEFRFTPSKTGVFVGQCSVFCGKGHASMKLTVRVVD